MKSAASTRQQVIERLTGHRSEIRRLGAASLHLFGSTARNDLDAHSDIDVLVAFEGPATFDAYMSLKFFLQDLLGRKVDLVTSRGIKPSLRARIAPDLIDVA